MRLISTVSLQPKMVLARPIFNGQGMVLLSEGVSLSDRMIKRLIEMGITYVYIKDTFTNDLKIKSPISETTKMEAIHSIKESFEHIKDEKALSHTFVLNQISKKFTFVVRDILQQIQNHKDVISLLSEVHTYDHYIFTHSLNVTIYSLALGVALKLPQRKLEQIGLGAMLHDVGKLLVPHDILTKPDRLTDEEFNVVKKHAEDGFNILLKIPNIPLVSAHCAYQHHERLDGSGYPRGLVADEIHYFGKIIAVADVYDAVTSNRVYRHAMLPNEALELLYAGAGTKFDLSLVEAFRKTIAAYPIGISVYLNDGRKGIIVKQNKGSSDRPIVRVIEENGVRVDTPYEVNLMKELSVTIVDTDITLQSKN